MVQDACYAKAVHNTGSSQITKVSGSTSRSTAAAVTNANINNNLNASNDFVASIFPSTDIGVIGDGSFSDRSNSSYLSVSENPPLKGKHFTWNCVIDGPKVAFPVKSDSLIDSGCHLFWSDLTLLTNLASLYFRLIPLNQSTSL